MMVFQGMIQSDRGGGEVCSVVSDEPLAVRFLGTRAPVGQKNATFSEKVALVGLAAFSMNGRASGQIRGDRKLPALRKKESDEPHGYFLGGTGP
jgi:hypothetical protein